MNSRYINFGHEIRTSHKYKQIMIYNTFKCTFKPGFHMSGKSQTIADFVISRPFQTFPSYENTTRLMSPIVSLSRKCLGRSGNNKIPDGLGFSRHDNQALTSISEQMFTIKRFF